MLRATSIRSARALAPALALTLFAGAPLAADGPEIARIAPDRALFVISIPDWPQFRQTALDSNLGRLWEEPQIAKLINDALEEPTKQFTSFLESINADAEDLEHPTGHVGFAGFFPQNEDGVVDAEGDEHFLIVAEFGEHADAWKDLIDKYIDRGLDDRTLTTEDDEYREIEITIITPVYLEDPHADCGDDCKHEPGLAEALGGSFQDQRPLAIARIQNSFIFSNDLRGLESAIERATGDGREALADSDAYRDAADNHPAGTLAHGVIFAGPLLNMLFEEEGEQAQQFAQLLGLSALRSVGASLRLDTADSVAEIAFSANMQEKSGIFELMDETGGAFDPPGFVPPGAASTSRFSFRFDKVMEVARKIVQALPEEGRAEMQMMLDQASGIAGPLFDALGTNIYAVTSYRQPYDAESTQMLYAIDVTDELTVTNTFDFLVAQAGGMVETRDFDGTAIYFSDAAPVEIAAAVGFGRLFIGSTTAVENALRASGQPDAPRLAEEKDFRAATRALSDRALGFSYTDMNQWLNWQWWSWQNAEKILERTLDQAGIDGEYRDEILRQTRENTPEWQKDLPPVETITRYLGDMVYELRSEEDGFAGRVYLLKPADQ